MAGLGQNEKTSEKETTETGHPSKLKALAARAPVRRASARARRP